MCGIVKTVLFSLMLVAAACTLPNFSRGQDSGASIEDDLKLLKGLRQRRLFSIANLHCDRRLKSQSLSKRSEAMLHVEKIINETQRAFLQVETNEPWESPNTIANLFIARNSKHPFAKLVETQSALVDLTHGQWIARNPQKLNAPGGRENALKNLRSASTKLEKIERELQRMLPQAKTASKSDDALSKSELRSLRINALYQHSRALLARAKLYAVDDQLNRVNALHQITQRHDELLKNLQSSDELWWNVQIDRATVARLLNSQSNQQDISALIEKAPDDSKKGRLLAEKLRNLALRKQLDELAKIVKPEQPYNNADLDLANVEALVALSQAQKDKDKAAQYQQLAVNCTRRIEQNHGKFWGRLANQVLVASAELNPAAANLQILVRLADQTFLKGQYDEAIKAYMAASAKAKSSGDTKSQFELAYKAGLVDRKRGYVEKAAERFRTLALEMKTYESANQSHLMAIVSLAQLASKDRQKLTQYMESLAEHIANWPDKETANQARIWLAQNQIRTRDYKKAIETSLNVPASSPNYISALGTAADSAMRWHRYDIEKFDQAFCRSAFLPLVSKLVETSNWQTPEQSIAAIVGELNQRIQLADNSRLVERIRKLLNDSFTFAEYRDKAIQIVVIADSKNDKAVDAKLMEELCRLSSAKTIATLHKVAATAKKRDAAAGQLIETSLAQLAGFEAKKIPPVKLLSKETNQRQILRAKSLVLQSRREPALELIQRLVKSNSKNGELREAYAELLSDSTSKEELKTALNQWRIIVRGSPPRSPRWFRAKLGIAKCLIAQNEKAKAKAFLTYLKVTPPGWNESELKNEFERLLKKSGN